MKSEPTTQPASKEQVIEPADIGDELPCLLCNGPLMLKGTLGCREWFRCRNCGMDYGREIPYPSSNHTGA